MSVYPGTALGLWELQMSVYPELLLYQNVKNKMDRENDE
jgi:hypothetical protein